MIDGILPIDKPIGWTSHDVVARVRRIAGQKHVGHAGTLDPLASGLLLLVLGTATRLSSYLMASAKTYCAEVVLGATTRTDDAEGPLQSETRVSLDRDTVERVVQGFCGEIDQVPPLYAAVRHHGQKLYVLARKGETVRPEPRRVQIDRIDILRWSPPRLRLRIVCGSGTYIRALARDIGSALGTGGYLHALRRVESGAFRVDTAAVLEGLDRDRLVQCVQPADLAVTGLPAVVLDQVRARRLVQGNGVPMAEDGEWRDRAMGSPSDDRVVRVYDMDGGLLALAAVHDGVLRPRRVFLRG